MHVTSLSQAVVCVSVMPAQGLEKETWQTRGVKFIRSFNILSTCLSSKLHTQVVHAWTANSLAHHLKHCMYIIYGMNLGQKMRLPSGRVRNEIYLPKMDIQLAPGNRAVLNVVPRELEDPPVI